MGLLVPESNFHPVPFPDRLSVVLESQTTTLSLPGWMRGFAALRHRNYRVFFFGQLISLTGTWMQAMAQGWLVYDLSNSTFTLGLISFLGFFPVTILSAPAGAMADHWDKRRVLVITQTVSMTLALILAGLAFWGVVTVWHVAALSVLLGITNAFDIPTRQSFIMELVGRDDLASAIALNSTMFNMARIAGPSLAAVLIGTIGVAGCFLINGLSYVAVIAGYAVMRLPKRSVPIASPTVWNAMRAPLRFARHEDVVRRILILVALSSLFVFPFMTLLPVFAREYLRGDARLYGLLGSVYGLGALIGSLSVAWLGQSRRQREMFFGGLFGFCAGSALFAWSRIPVLSFLSMIFSGWCFITVMATANSSVQLRTPDSMRGGVMGLFTMAFLGLAPVGSLLLGSLAHWISAPAAVQSGAALCAVCALVMFGRSRAGK